MTIIYIDAMLICQSQIVYNQKEWNDWNSRFNLNFIATSYGIITQSLVESL